MLVIFGGLPGTGKTTIARELAWRLDAFYLRIDSIEQAMRRGLDLDPDIGPAGYLVAYAVAADNLGNGRTVVADSVNPIGITRRDWRAVATRASIPFFEVEVICSDAREHRRRVENRANDIDGLVLPDWDAVVARDYEPWRFPHLVLDTAEATAAECIESALEAIHGFTRP